MSIQKINVGGQDVEIEDVSARTNISNLTNEVNTLDGRVTTLENNSGGGGSEWVELTTNSAQEAEITQKFSEIRLLCSCSNDINYSVTYNFDNSIFHNKINGQTKYLICGNPFDNNYGCMFKYSVTSEGKQYVSVNTCFTGIYPMDNYTFKAWIKPTTNKQ